MIRWSKPGNFPAYVFEIEEHFLELPKKTEKIGSFPTFWLHRAILALNPYHFSENLVRREGTRDEVCVQKDTDGRSRATISPVSGINDPLKTLNN